MSTHVQVKALRNICFKISKLGSNTAQYAILRQTLLDTPGHLAHLTPEFIISCETPVTVRACLSELTPDDENRTVYKQRQRFLEQQFAELVYWSERDALSSVEIEALMQADCEDRATMDHVLRLMCDCAEVNPRRSLVMSRHAVLNSAMYLLQSNGMSADVKLEIQELFKQIIHMAEHPTMDQEIYFSPDRQFVASVMPLIEYIDKQNKYYDWEESNRVPNYPTVQTARHFCHAAILLCEILWRWSLDDLGPTMGRMDDPGRHSVLDE